MIYSKRLQNLQKSLSKYGCEAILIDEMINLHYLTGIEMSAGKLLVDQKGATLIVDGRYLEMCQKRSPFPVVLEKESVLANLLASSPSKLGFDSATTSFQNFIALEKLADKVNETRKVNPLTLVPADNPVLHLRAIKDPEEIELLRKAADLGSEGFDYVCSLLKEGVTEIELALELEIFWRRKGGKKLGFDPIIAFGPYTSMPHYRSGHAKLNKGDTVLIDIGVNLAGYHSDMTRVVFFGKPNPKVEEIYHVVKEAQQRALNLCKPGTLIGDLDSAARGYIIEKGFGEYFTHNLGHGVGLEIHELPSLKNKPPFKDQRLEENMVITIEPGVYLPDVGGVRIEDTVVITKNGHENLTNRSKEISIVK